MNINKIYIGAAVLLSLLATSCNEYLETEPQGFISAGSPTVDGAEGLVTAAYAGIGNDDMIGPMASMWVYGSVRSDDAYKGGGGVSDVEPFNFYGWPDSHLPGRIFTAPFHGQTQLCAH